MSLKPLDQPASQRSAAAGGHYLEQITDSSSHAQNLHDETAQPVDPKAVRVAMFRLQALARKLLPDHRVAWCMRRFQPHRSTMEYRYSEKRQAAYHYGLRCCEKLHECPVCARKISERRRNELETGLANSLFPVLRADGSVFFIPRYHQSMLTLTIRSELEHSADRMLNQIAAAWTAFSSGRWIQGFRQQYYVVAHLKALEMTHGIESGWHPHYHVLLLHDSQLNEEAQADMIASVRRRWAEKVADVGGYADPIHGADLKWGTNKLYPVKVAGDREIREWNLIAETTKQSVKRGQGKEHRSMLDLLMLYGQGDDSAGKLWIEAVYALSGRRWLEGSKGFWKLLKVTPVSDETAAEQETDEADRVLAVLTWEEWKLVLKHDARGHDLDRAADGKAESLWAYLQTLGIVRGGR